MEFPNAVIVFIAKYNALVDSCFAFLRLVLLFGGLVLLMMFLLLLMLFVIGKCGFSNGESWL